MGFVVTGKDITNPSAHTAMRKLMTSSHYMDHKQAYKVNRLVGITSQKLNEYSDEIKKSFEAAATECGVDPKEAGAKVNHALEKKAREIRATMDTKEIMIEWHQLAKEDLGPVKLSPEELAAMEPFIDPAYFSEITS